MLRLAAIALVIALASVAPAVAEEIHLGVTECDPSGTPEEREACESPEDDTQREETHTIAPAPGPAPPASDPQPEVNDYSLETGTGERTAGDDTDKIQLESLDLELKDDQAAEDEDEHDHGGVDFAPDSDLMPTVATTGGSQFAGFGSSFQFMTSDEALAQFAVPPFLVPIYVAAGRAYGVPWNVLAAINKIETDFGRIKHQVSYAGALGWMQFMPGTWRAYGVDASGDGVADPSNPVDAIYAAARYLSASGAPTDMRRAIFAYNHADWYVDQVLHTANIYGSMPGGLVAETGSLAFGRFPVLGPVSYGDDFRSAQAAGRRPEGLRIESRRRAAVIATQNVTVKTILLDRRLARAFRRQGHLPARGLSPAPVAPEGSAPAPVQDVAATGLLGAVARAAVAAASAVAAAPTDAPRSGRRGSRGLSRGSHGLPRGYARSSRAGIGVVVEDGVGNTYRYTGLQRVRPGVRPGAKLSGSQRIGRLSRKQPALLFSVRAAGGAPVDPRPLVDGYRLQEAADFYHALGPAGGNPFLPDSASDAPGGVIAGSQAELAARVLNDSGIQVYPCGRQDIAGGVVDKRVLAAMLYLRKSGLELTVTSLRCGHGYYTASGNVSAHSFGSAMDIAAFNGQPVTGNQGAGSLTEQAVKLLMQLDGGAQPSQLISLMSLGGPSFAMADHYDHLHVGYQFQQAIGVGRSGNALGPVTFDGKSDGVLRGGTASKAEERKLSRRLSSIANPEVRRDRGQGSIEVEAEHRDERSEAEALARRDRPPFEATATAAGARIVDIDIPLGRRGDEAYAIGTVAGAGHKGWAEHQTVVLAHQAGVWRIVGAPVDSRGKLRNPKLRTLATTARGAGYAVGDRGAVVLLRGLRQPRLVRSHAKSALLAVDVRRVGRRVEGVAVGRRGAALALRGAGVTRENVGSRRATLTSVALDSQGGAVAAASSTPGVDPALVYRRTGSSWTPVDAQLGLPEAAGVRLTSIAAARGEIWVAGAISDARTLGTPAELPLVAQLSEGGQWTTYCAGTPALAAIRELGAQRRECDQPLVSPAEARGPAGDVAITRPGVLVTTPGGIYLLRYTRFEPLPADPGALVSDDGLPARLKLAVSAAATGWAIGSDGRLVRIGASGDSPCDACDTRWLPFGSGARLEAAPGSDRALAAAGADAAAWDGEHWGSTSGPGSELRDLAWSSRDDAWAVAETGTLLKYSGGKWSAPGETTLVGTARERLMQALGRRSLIADQAGASAALEALSFRSSDEGYAVGAGGIWRFDGDDWRSEDSPTSEMLTDVASTPKATVAVGAKGTLLRRDDGEWRQDEDVRALVGDKDFTAIDGLSDGTTLAVAGGTLIEKPADDGWRIAAIAPLGMPVAELAALRTSGGLVALALVGAGEEKTLLQGTAAGWEAVPLPVGSRPLDIDLEAAGKQLWVSALRGEGTVAIRLSLGAVKTGGAGAKSLIAATGGPIEAVGTQIQQLVGATRGAQRKVGGR